MLIADWMDSVVPAMNLSLNSTLTVAVNERDTFASAVIKNVIVTALCVSINYINSVLVHTFRKHQVWHCFY